MKRALPSKAEKVSTLTPRKRGDIKYITIPKLKIKNDFINYFLNCKKLKFIFILGVGFSAILGRALFTKFIFVLRKK